ncbi:hypothetical protein ACN47E_009294 [Coniothyrium glycines]
MGNIFSSTPVEEWNSDAHRAMEDGVSCVICGGPFDIEGDVYGIDPKDPRFQWLYDFRLLGTIEAAISHVVASEDSVPLNESETGGIFLSEPAAYSMSGSQFVQVPGHDGPRDVWYGTMQPDLGGGTLFPLHEVCLDICRRAIDSHQMKQSRTAIPNLTVLTELLNTRFDYRHVHAGTSTSKKNDLFNLCASQDMFGPQSVLAMSRIEWWGREFEKFYANPAANFDAASFVIALLQASPRNEVAQPVSCTPRRTRVSLERLPPELIDSICAYLPVRAVISLHRTSRALHNMTPLDNMFWRDSLRQGKLHPHMRDLDTRWIEHRLSTLDSGVLDKASSWDWKGAAQLLATKRFPISGRDGRLHEIPDEYWNRCRIWSIIEEALAEDFAATRKRNDSLVRTSIP